MEPATCAEAQQRVDDIQVFERELARLERAAGCSCPRSSATASTTTSSAP